MSKGIFKIIGFENPELSERLRQALKTRGVSIRSLRLEHISAPETGDPLVQATVVADLPDDVPLRDAEKAMENVSTDLNVIHC